jgi:hypothetical protein
MDESRLFLSINEKKGCLKRGKPLLFRQPSKMDRYENPERLKVLINGPFYIKRKTIIFQKLWDLSDIIFHDM